MRLTVAAVQDFPVYLDLEKTLEKSIDLINRAADAGADLVVFPECWLSGYPFWCWRISDEHNEALRETNLRLHRSGISVPGPETELLGSAARETGIFVVMGINERVGPASLFNSQLYIDGDGRVLGVHRKLVPTYAERMIWSWGNGSTLRVFDTDIGRLGGLICWEHWMPLARFALYSEGMEICASCWPATRTGKSLLAGQNMALDRKSVV